MIISDNGSVNGPWPPGLGLTSIQLRASEVGGVCEAGPTADGGRVVAILRWERVDDQGLGGR